MVDLRLSGNIGNLRQKRKVAWGITGSGDKLEVTLEVMKRIIGQYEDTVTVQV